MKKIFSQLAGAAAVVATVSAGLAYAQGGVGAGGPGASAPSNVNSSSTGAPRNTPNTAGTVYEGGVNNGSTYVRSNQLGNAAPAERPAPGSTSTTGTAATTTTATTPMPAATASPGYDNSTSGTPAPATTSSTTAASTASPDLSSASNTGWNADGTRAARADRN